MIDIKKALSQRCYIIFESNEQLRKFFDDNRIEPYMGAIDDEETYISVHPNDSFISVREDEIGDRDAPTYHHTELTMTDDGE
jgi:hypothetical protein